MAEFRLEGAEGFREKLGLIKRKAPDRIMDKLDDTGKEFVKRARANTPKVSGNLRKGYMALPVEKIAGGYQKGITNKAPHFHLVERGHRKVSRTGQEIGWTEGKFYLERTVKENEEEIAEDLDKWLDELYKELL